MSLGDIFKDALHKVEEVAVPLAETVAKNEIDKVDPSGTLSGIATTVASEAISKVTDKVTNTVTDKVSTIHTNSSSTLDDFKKILEDLVEKSKELQKTIQDDLEKVTKIVNFLEELK